MENKTFSIIELFSGIAVVSTTDVRFDGLSIALDCANGSASVCAKEIFTSLGAKCLMLSDTPDGTNINDNCGSTHPE